jgi:diguanylate cyclase (GGDEF)-like protein
LPGSIDPHADLQRLIAELREALGADVGAAVYLPDREGLLHPAASAGPEEPTPDPTGARRTFGIRRASNWPDQSSALVLPVPGGGPGFLYVARKGGSFSPAERAVARRHAARVVDGPGDGKPLGPEWVGLRQLEAIQRIGARMTRLSSLEELGLALCVEMKEVLDYDSARIYVVESNGVDLTPVAFRSEHELYQRETFEALRARVGEDRGGLTGWVAARGRSLIVGDATKDPRAVQIPGTDEFVESMLLVPLRYEGRVTGVIVLSKLGANQFDEDDLRLLHILADQAAVAVENARLLAGHERLVAELQALVEIGRTAAESSDETGVATILARKLRTAAGVDVCILSRWEESSTILRTLAWAGTGDLKARYDIGHDKPIRQVLREGRPLVLHADDPEADPTGRARLDRPDEESLLLLPLKAGGRTVGLIELINRSVRREFSPQDLEFFVTMADHAATVLENARLLHTFRQVADVDQLTGVANHRYLQERLRQESARAARTKRPLSVLMVDLDGFKEVNDAHGHSEGDGVLAAVAAALRLAVRDNDVVARYGGDEFVILMPDTAEKDATVVAERVLSTVADSPYRLRDGTEIALSASAGLAIYPADGRNPATLLAAADRSMYAVKREGGRGVRRAERRSVATDRRSTGSDRRLPALETGELDSLEGAETADGAQSAGQGDEPNQVESTNRAD